MTRTPVLDLLDFTKPFLLKMQMHQGLVWHRFQQNGHPIVYFSKIFSKVLQNASAYVRELHAMVTWRHYLLGNKLIIETDQTRLRELLNQTIQTPNQLHYLSKLSGYVYMIFVSLVRKTKQLVNFLEKKWSAYLLVSSFSYQHLTSLSKLNWKMILFLICKSCTLSLLILHPNILLPNGLMA